jgi:hypothetical protein
MNTPNYALAAECVNGVGLDGRATAKAPSSSCTVALKARTIRQTPVHHRKPRAIIDGYDEIEVASTIVERHDQRRTCLPAWLKTIGSQLPR